MKPIRMTYYRADETLAAHIRAALKRREPVLIAMDGEMYPLQVMIPLSQHPGIDVVASDDPDLINERKRTNG